LYTFTGPRNERRSMHAVPHAKDIRVARRKRQE
jgi:hypothetical protein